MTTFKVDNVAPSRDRLPTATHRTVFEKLVQSPLEAVCRPEDKLVQGDGFHALIEAAHLAFQSHYPLRLKPDYLFITVNQGFATHVNQNSEQYRDKFVQHDGKKTIAIYRPDFTVGNPNNDWPSCFGDFSKQIREHIGAENHARFLADFSTTGPVARTVSEIVLMDVVQSYFTYSVFTDCGIPSITLDGTTADWQKLRDHVAGLKQYGGLDWWLDELVPIFDQFVAAKQGKVDQAFWGSIYKFEGSSMSSLVSGWLAKLLPYTKSWGNTQRNPIFGGGRDSIDVSELPSSISTVPFDFDGAPYQFIAGHTGVVQESDGTVRPALGWAVRPAPAAPAAPAHDDSQLETTANASTGERLDVLTSDTPDFGERLDVLTSDTSDFGERLDVLTSDTPQNGPKLDVLTSRTRRRGIQLDAYSPR